MGAMTATPANSVVTGVSVLWSVRLEELPALDLRGLSELFDPFLPQFVRGALRGGGEVWASEDGTAVNGLLLHNGLEQVGSIFTRQRSVAERLSGFHPGSAMFSDFPLGERPEPFLVLEARADGPPVPRPFRHAVQMAGRDDMPEVVRMMTELYGRVDARGLQPVLPGEEACLVVRVGEEVAGAGWVSVVGPHARLHSLSVRPRYRRMGIGRDLWRARWEWARQAGARRLISEVASQNTASLAIAAQGGMRPVGTIYLCGPAAGRPGLDSR